MKLKEIECRNFMLFGNNQVHKIVLDENVNVWSIIGRWNDNINRSNESGKSTITDLILYAFYGKQRSKNDLINKDSDDNMYVKVVLSYDEDENIEILRSDKIFEVTDHEGEDKRILQNILNEKIGIDYESFISINCFVQGEIHNFIEANSIDKKKMIIKWLEKTYWKLLEDQVKKELNELLKKIDLINNEIEVLNSNNINEYEIKKSININKQEKENYVKKIEKLRKRLEVIKKELEKFDEIEKLNDLKNEYESFIRYNENSCKKYKENISKLENEKLLALKAVNEINLIKDKLKSKEDIENHFKQFFNNKNKIEKELDILEEQIINIDSKLKKISNFSMCPVVKNIECTLINKKDLIKNYEIEKKNLQIRVKTLNERLKNINDKLFFLEQKINDFKEFEKRLIKLSNIRPINGITNEISKINKTIKELQEKNKEYKEKLVNIEEKINSILKDLNLYELKKEKRIINDEIEEFEEKISKIDRYIGMLLQKIKDNKSNLEKIKELKSKLNIYEQKVSLHKFLVYMFGKNGIPSHQIEDAFGEIEEIINMILKKLKTGYSIEFSPTRELNQFEKECPLCNVSFNKDNKCPECDRLRQKKKKDELVFEIYNNGNKYDFKSLSGGAKVLLSLAVRIALTKFIRDRKNNNCNILILDEIFGMLDEVNRNLVIELILDTLVNDLSFEQIFVISHTDVKDDIPNKILVTRYKKYSTMEIV